MTVRARFDGKVFVPIDPVEVTKDQIVELEVRAATTPAKGSPALLREVMRRGPKLQPGDAAALEESINAGKRPMRFDDPFDRSKRA